MEFSDENDLFSFHCRVIREQKILLTVKIVGVGDPKKDCSKDQLSLVLVF